MLTTISVPNPGLLHTSRLPPNLLGALAHPVQAKVAGRRVAPDRVLVEPSAIIAHADPEPPLVVADLGGDVLRSRVSQGIAQRLPVMR